MSIICRKIKDENVIWLIRRILNNYDSGRSGAGMPLGNWTSQFFANVYLNELDYFVKHKLKAKHYIRYVDDFVILHHSWDTLKGYELAIKDFLPGLKISLHPNKCKIIPLVRGVPFLGFKIFPFHRVPRKRNLRKIKGRLGDFVKSYEVGCMQAWTILDSWYGWNGYAMHGNTHQLRKRMQKDLIRDLERIAKSKSR